MPTGREELKGRSLLELFMEGRLGDAGPTPAIFRDKAQEEETPAAPEPAEEGQAMAEVCSD